MSFKIGDVVNVDYRKITKDGPDFFYRWGYSAGASGLVKAEVVAIKMSNSAPIRVRPYATNCITTLDVWWCDLAAVSLFKSSRESISDALVIEYRKLTLAE